MAGVHGTSVVKFADALEHLAINTMPPTEPQTALTCAGAAPEPNPPLGLGHLPCNSSSCKIDMIGSGDNKRVN